MSAALLWDTISETYHAAVDGHAQCEVIGCSLLTASYKAMQLLLKDARHLVHTCTCMYGTLLE